MQRAWDKNPIVHEVHEDPLVAEQVLHGGIQFEQVWFNVFW